MSIQSPSHNLYTAPLRSCSQKFNALKENCLSVQKYATEKTRQIGLFFSNMQVSIGLYGRVCCGGALGGSAGLWLGVTLGTFLSTINLPLLAISGVGIGVFTSLCYGVSSLTTKSECSKEDMNQVKEITNQIVQEVFSDPISPEFIEQIHSNVINEVYFKHESSSQKEGSNSILHYATQKIKQISLLFSNMKVSMNLLGQMFCGAALAGSSFLLVGAVLSCLISMGNCLLPLVISGVFIGALIALNNGVNEVIAQFKEVMEEEIRKTVREQLTPELIAQIHPNTMNLPH